MESAYEPKKYEAEIYQRWEASGFFNPDKLPGKRQKKYSIVIPPPNVTGSLHLGHALNNTIQDILIRFYRLAGFKTLWLPGTDHAGIATQFKVEQKLAQEGKTRFDLGREKFVQKVWEWKDLFEKTILGQLKTLGCSCDWSRTRFTMDDNYSLAVWTAFKTYWDKGYIYQGKKVVNWCPRCHTSLSDLELEYKEEKAKLYWIKYGPFLLATTRPETKLGDTAVAVNPRDERYKSMVGKKYTIPGVLGDFEIVVVADEVVDKDFGSGAVKVTPAHDAVDYEISMRHKIPMKQVIDENGRMMANTGKYQGMTTLEARKAIVEDMQKMGLIDHIDENYIHNNAHCYRCGTIIEPIPSQQWFVKMEKLVKPAMAAVAKQKINIVPERYQKVYLDWLKNIKDWCISRQLWWGHRLPVWFCQNQKEKFIVNFERPTKCPICGQCIMRQSEDVLDTWFSSALWPFATLGWPDKTKDLADYYPTSLLSTARDILYLWVARMVFSGLEFVKKIPFHDVYIHSTILNPEGKRMSKSLGTGVDPLGLIEQYGADATRLGLIMQINRDQQAIKFDERSILSARNFINKLWNVSRFISLQYEKITDLKKNNGSPRPMTLSDKWVLSSFNRLIDGTNKKIKNYEFGEAATALYSFTWHELADWYLEIAKWQMNDEKLKSNTAQILKFIVQSLLKLWHPFIPFVTEEIYQQIGLGHGRGNDLLMITTWPIVDKKAINNKTEKMFYESKYWTVLARRCRSEVKISPKETISLDKLLALFKAGDQAIYGDLEKRYNKSTNEQKEIIRYLVKIN